MKKTFIKKGMREIWAHKVQYFLLALVIGLGVAAYSSFNDFSRYRKDGLDQIFEESQFMDLQVSINYGSALNSSVVEDILGQDHIDQKVRSWEMRLVFEVFIEHHYEGEMKVTKGLVMGQFVPEGSDPGEAIDVNSPLFYVDDPSTYDLSRNQCYQERKFSEAYGLKSGDTINVNRGKTSMDVEIVEQAAIPEYFMVIREGDFAPSERSFGVMLMPIDTSMELYSGDQSNSILVNDVVLTVEEGTDIDSLKEDLQDAFESNRVAVKFTEKDENPSRYFLITDYENDRDSMAIFPVIIFGVSAFGLVMALRRMIRSHRPQIGIFKALGLRDRTIMIYFSIIAVFIALLGTVLGWLLSIPLNMAFQSLGESLLDFPVDDYNITYIYYVYGALISIVLCLSCTLIPAALAVRVKPIDVIQGKEGVSKKQVGKLGGVLGRSRWLPVSLKLTVRNQLRKPLKSLSTIIGVGMSLALFLGFMMVFQSALSALDATTEGMDWDYEITLEGFQPDMVSQGWKQEHEVIENVDNAIILPTSIEPDGESMDTVIYAVEDLTSVFSLEFERGGPRDGMIILSWYHADRIGVRPGDTVALELPVMGPDGGFSTGIKELTVSGIQSNYMGTFAFMDLATLQNVTGLHHMVNTVYLRTVGGDSDREMENTLIREKGISSVTYIKEREGLLDQYLDIFIGVVAIMAMISVLLAGAIVYTMFRISAREQERDYATMKTLGTSLFKISKLIFQEGAYITVPGIGLGVLGGYALSEYMLKQNDEWESFGMTTQFSWPAFIFGSLLIIFVVVFVSLLTMRYISRINIANVIRERAAG